MDTWNLQLVEFFSGVSRVARIARRCGLRSRAFEINFDHEHKQKYRESTHNKKKKRAFMDINGEAGFVFLGIYGIPSR